MLSILTQDHDQIINFNEGDTIHTLPNVRKGVFYGINLYLRGKLLGTFDTVQEAKEEMENIVNCEHEYYCISGFSDWDIVEHLMLN